MRRKPKLGQTSTRLEPGHERLTSISVTFELATSEECLLLVVSPSQEHSVRAAALGDLFFGQLRIVLVAPQEPLRHLVRVSRCLLDRHVAVARMLERLCPVRRAYSTHRLSVPRHWDEQSPHQISPRRTVLPSTMQNCSHPRSTNANLSIIPAATASSAARTAA